MNTRIKIYTILLAIVYIVVIGYSFLEGINDFKKGYEEGAKAQYSINGTDDTNPTLSVILRPTSSDKLFSTRVTNMIDGKSVEIKLTNMEVDVSGYSNRESPKGVIGIICICSLIFVIPFVMFCVIGLPVFFFRAVYHILKNGVMNGVVIRNIKRAGWCILGIFLIGFVAMNYYTYNIDSIFQLEGYEVVKNTSGDYVILILGLITLFLGEILGESKKMKEDQDLTI